MKKYCMFMFAVIIAGTMLLFPVSAETPSDLSENVVSSIDYRTENPFDSTGNLIFDGVDPDSFNYFDFDGILCVNNDSFEGSNGIRMQCNDNYQKLNEVFTIEAYIYMSSTLSLTPIDFWWGGDEPAWGRLFWDGSRFGFGQSRDYEPQNPVMESEDRILEDAWYHVAVTSDGTTTNIYVNGELTGSGSHTAGGMSGLWYCWIAHTDQPGYGIAYLTIYNTAATAEQVKAMYDPSYAPPVTSEPTVTPSAENSPTSVPTSVPTDVPTAVPTKAPEQTNTETFDIGVVSMAALAFSSLTTFKKRKISSR